MEQISYVDQVSCYLIKNCDLYRGTNKQTDKQTNRQTNILANFFEILASNK